MKAEFALAAIQGEKTIAPIEGEDGIPLRRIRIRRDTA